MMRIAIIGVGSIGGILLGALSDTDAEMVAVARGTTATELSDMGLVMHMPEGSIEVIPPDAFSTFDSAAGPVPDEIHGSCDAAILCGKADSTPMLVQLAEDVLTPQGVAISVQNGLGHAEVLAHRLGRSRVLGGSITHGAWRDGEGSVHWVGRGAIRLGWIEGGAPSGAAAGLLSALAAAGLEPEWSEDMQRIVWTKLLVNVAINPVCSIAGVRNGALLEMPELWEQALGAMQEAATVAEASGVDLGDLVLDDYLRQVAGATAENRCSMLQDVMAGRLTEIDALCGAVVSQGESVGVPTPRNAMLHALVKGIQISPHFD